LKNGNPPLSQLKTMLNVTAVGYLIADPEFKETKNGFKFASFRVLVNKKRGEEEIVNQIDCTVWGDKLKGIKYLSKGNQVTVSGSCILKAFQKRDGSAGCCIELNVNEYTLPQRPKVEVPM